jgi:hypothetical protein
MNTRTGVLLMMVVALLICGYQGNLGPNSNPFAPPPVNPQPNSIHPPR